MPVLYFADEEDNEEEVTYREMYVEVERYTAAFRKNGLQKGDRVACKYWKMHDVFTIKRQKPFETF